jgi:hypothetical protein
MNQELNRLGGMFKMKIFQKIGGFAAFYLAMAYLVTIPIFIFILDYPSIVEPSQKMDLIVNQTALMYLTNIISYVFFGFFLILLNLSLYEKLNDKSPNMMKVATVIGIIWGCLLIGSGMVANAGMTQAIALFKDNPDQGTTLWCGIEAVANGMGGQNGEILGGVMTLLISIAGLRSGLLPKRLNYLGIILGTIGIISIVPGLTDLCSVFGMIQIIWFIGIGVVLLKQPQMKAVYNLRE